MEEDDYAAQLQALREKYAAELPEKLKEIERYWQKVNNNEDYQESLKTLYRLLHGIAGSGATFGFADLGTRAREVEQMLKNCIQEEIQPDQQVKSGVELFIKGFGEMLASPGE